MSWSAFVAAPVPTGAPGCPGQTFVSRRDAKLTKTQIGESLNKFHFRVMTPLKSPKSDLFGSTRLSLPV